MKSFNDIIGHDKIKNHIKNAIKVNKVSHAYIIEGDQGLGKSDLANIIAKTLQCEKNSIDPCNDCSSCRNFDEKNHPDIIYVQATKKTGIGVEDIREQINTDIHIKPYKYLYKIYIIKEADTMTIQAQNALLKTIEEPPLYGIFILLAENAKRLLPTILSRCVVFSLKNISEVQIKNYLMREYNLIEEQAKFYTAFSRGNIGKAKQLASSDEFIRIRHDLIAMMEAVCHNKDLEIIEKCSLFESYKENIDIVMDLLLTWLRDLLMIKNVHNHQYLMNQDCEQTLLEQSKVLSYNRINTLLQRVEEVRKALKFHSNYQASIETLFLNIDRIE